jgi:hypothetical protein
MIILISVRINRSVFIPKCNVMRGRRGRRDDKGEKRVEAVQSKESEQRGHEDKDLWRWHLPFLSEQLRSAFSMFSSKKL